jgi:transposase
VHDLPADLKRELGEENLIPLADVVSFQYDYRAAKLVVLRHVQKKYLCRAAAATEVAADSPAAADATAPTPRPPYPPAKRNAKRNRPDVYTRVA